MRVKYNNSHDLLESMSFMTLGLGETKLTIGEGPGALNFILDFAKAEGKEPNFSISTIDTHNVKLQFINWDNPLGITFNDPIEVGTFGGRKLFILVHVKKAGSRGEYRDVTFTAYLGEKDRDA